MSLDKAIKSMKYDSRLVNHNLSNGNLTPEELKKHLETLPDLANQSEKIDLEQSKQSKSESH